GARARDGEGARRWLRYRRQQGRLLRAVRCDLAAHAPGRCDARHRQGGRPRADETNGYAGQYQPRRPRRAGCALECAARRKAGLRRGRRVREGAAARHRRSPPEYGQCRGDPAYRLRLARRIRDSIHRYLRSNRLIRRGLARQCRQSRCAGAPAEVTRKEKDRPRAAGPSLLELWGRSELLVRGSGCAVDRFLGRFLGIAECLLALALDLLDRAFALQAIGTDGFADALLGLADGFVGRALDLVAGGTHENSPPLN